MDTELSKPDNVCPDWNVHVCDIVSYISPKITEERARKVPLIIPHSSFQNHILRFTRVVARKCPAQKIRLGVSAAFGASTTSIKTNLISFCVIVLLVSIYNISLQTLLLAKGINMVEGGPTPNVETPPPKT